MMQPAISTLPRIPSCSYPGSSVHFFMIKRFCGPLIKTVQTTQRIRGNSGVAHNRVLLLHGFPNFWYAWKNQLNMLKSAGYHIIAPDLRGYNASSQPVDVMSYSRRNINADLISLIQYFNLGKPTNIVGHDWGGTVALCFAEDNPDLVRRLVVVNAPHLEQMKNLLMTSPRQLLRSWYMFFIQIPWLPEWCLSLDRFNALRKSLPASFPVEDVDKHHIGQCGTILKILTASFYMLSIETTEL
eukprot:TRINITY_DN11676_c0_g1_i7.p1 TRINITY_DN11676_c0_g1~~TRINITY_DN11676_c0_g1_i7.p1  ORF type:complete len:242 (+),score=14.33 TRINITY_DN11676_c0_g1_i7:194-919(+)